jgi:hypothetical protein
MDMSLKDYCSGLAHLPPLTSVKKALAILLWHEINSSGRIRGTVDPAFKLLKDRGLFVGKGEYEIPTDKISSAIEMLSRERGK